MKRLLALLVSGLAVQFGGSVFALTPVDTYVFTATPGTTDYNSDFDGSAITINDGGVFAFSFYDTALSSSPYTSSEAYTVDENNITSFDSTGWNGSFEVTVDGVEFDAEGTGAVLNGVNGSMDTVTQSDPKGAWGTPGAKTPDASEAFPLLLGSFGLLAAARSRFGR